MLVSVLHTTSCMSLFSVSD